jgi:hypothetical protein
MFYGSGPQQGHAGGGCHYMIKFAEDVNKRVNKKLASMAGEKLAEKLAALTPYLDLRSIFGKEFDARSVLKRIGNQIESIGAKETKVLPSVSPALGYPRGTSGGFTSFESGDMLPRITPAVRKEGLPKNFSLDRMLAVDPAARKPLRDAALNTPGMEKFEESLRGPITPDRVDSARMHLPGQAPFHDGGSKIITPHDFVMDRLDAVQQGEKALRAHHIQETGAI